MTVGTAFFGGGAIGGGGGSGGVVTWNPLDKHADIGLSGGSLVAQKDAGDATRTVRATFGRAHTDNGYFEVAVAIFGPGTNTAPFRAVGLSTTSLPVANYCGSDTNSWAYYEQTGQKIANAVFTAYGSTYTDLDTVCVAFKNGKVWFGKNGVWQGGGDPAAGTGEAFSGITGTVYPTASIYKGAASPKHQAVLRTASYSCLYSIPSGFLYWER